MANNNVNMSELKRSFTGSFTGSFCICNVNLADDSAVSVPCYCHILYWNKIPQPARVSRLGYIFVMSYL